MPVLPRSRWFARALCLPALLVALLAPAAADTIYYPRAESLDDTRGDYAFELLQLALKKVGSAHQVRETPIYMQQNRAILELVMDSPQVAIMATMTSRRREEQLLPIRIPLSKGLIGWRIGLVRADRRELLRNVRDLDGLRPFHTGQGHDWPDTEILRASGLPVHVVSAYDNLFGMLKAGRVDWVPRSVNEIWSEAERYPMLAIEPHLLLHYPTADYYFVNRRNTALAEQVRRGLELAIADGSFDQLFYQHYGTLIKRARLGQRRIIELPNPLLSPQTPLARKELWLTLDELRRRKLAD